MRPLSLGYLTLVIAQVGISLNVVITKSLLTTMPMFVLLTSRFLISSVLLGLLLKVTNTPICDPNHPQQQLTRSDWFLASLQGVFAAFLFNLFFGWGLQHTTATAAGIVSSTLPAIIALCAVWLLKEKLDNPKILALLLSMLGILIINLDQLEVTTRNPNHHYLGDLLVFIAMFPEAWYSILGRKLAGRITPLGAAFISNVIGFIMLLPFGLMTASLQDLTLYSWTEGSLLFLSAFCSLIFFWAWGWGLTLISASTAAIFGGVMPIATTAFAILFLSERLQWYDMIGILLVVMSIFIGTGRSGLPKKVVTAPTSDPS